MAFSLTTYLKETYAELKKVTWPTRQEAFKSTLTVIAFSLIVAAFLGAIDYVFSLGLNYLIERV